MGGSKVSEDQKRADTVNIDTDDEDDDTFIDDESEDKMFDEEEEDNDNDDDDFKEITEELSRFPDAALLPNSLYANKNRMVNFFRHQIFIVAKAYKLGIQFL